MADLTKQLTHTLRIYFDSQINKHKINVQILMQKGVGVAEHPDIMQTIEDELGKIAEFKDKLEAQTDAWDVDPLDEIASLTTLIVYGKSSRAGITA